MVFNSMLVVSVAHISADAWQQIACCIGYHDRISSHQLLDLICCFPLQQLGRLALYFWTFLCLPPPDSYFTYYPSSTSSEDEDDVRYHRPYASSSSSSSLDFDDYYHHPHSD